MSHAIRWAMVSGLLLTACFERPSGAAGGVESGSVAYGTVMVAVGHRFEVLGRAVSGDRFELAAYELGELGEEFVDKLSHASPPREGHPEVLPQMLAPFIRTSLPDLEAALSTRDRTRILGAFQRTAEACNACHQASGHGFIEIPTEPGRPVPVTDRIATPR